MEQVIKVNDLDYLLLSRKIIETSRGPLWFCMPRLEDKLKTAYYYNKYFEEAKAQGLATIEESLKEHKKQGLWSDEKDQQLEKIPKFIQETEDAILSEKQSSKKKKLKEWLNTLHKVQLQLLNGQAQMYLNTAESVANERAANLLLYACYRNLDMSLLWPNFDDMLKSPNVNYLKELFLLYTACTEQYTETRLREIARSPEWRVRWASQKNNLNALFGRQHQDLNIDQFMLIYWSQIYDMVYEAYERPPEEIIQDDAKLDEWLKKTTEKQKQETRKRFYTGEITKKNTKFNKAGEVFSMVDGYYNNEGYFIPYTEEERIKRIEEIKATNSPIVRNQLKKEYKELEKRGPHLTPEIDIRPNDKVLSMMGATVGNKK